MTLQQELSETIPGPWASWTAVAPAKTSLDGFHPVGVISYRGGRIDTKWPTLEDFGESARSALEQNPDVLVILHDAEHERVHSVWGWDRKQNALIKADEGDFFDRFGMESWEIIEHARLRSRMTG